MVNQQLLDYIKQALQQGANQADIRNALLAAGWQPQDIEEALVAAETQRRTEARKEEVPVSPVSEFPGPTALLREVQTIFTQRLGTFIGIMLVPILVGVLFGTAMAAGGKFFLSLEPSASNIRLLIPLIISLVLIVFIAFVVQLWSQTALLYAIKDHEESLPAGRQGIGVREAYRRGWHKIRSYLWVSILIGFVSFGGFLLFVVPGIIFSIWFSFATFIVIAEDIGGMAALLKSREYVRGRWWGVVGRFLFFGLFIFVTVIPIIVLEVLGVPLIPDLGEIGASLFLTPLTMIYGFVIYKYLRALRGEFAFTPSRRSKAAFSLIGLLGPLFIIGTFALLVLLLKESGPGGGLPGISFSEARDVQRTTDQTNIKFALEEHYIDAYSYPSSLDELASKYLREIPVDPKTGLPYEYQVQIDGKDYELCIDFEIKPRECIDSGWREEGGKE